MGSCLFPSGAEFDFVKREGDDLVALLVYVDDIVLVWKNLTVLQDVQSFLQQHFKLKELGIWRYFLDFEVTQNASGMSLSQRHYALQLLEVEDTSCLAKKPADFQMVYSNKLSITEEELLPDPRLYRQLIGRFLYLTHIRPDITYVVNLTSQFVSSLDNHIPWLHIISYLISSRLLDLDYFSHHNPLFNSVALLVLTIVHVRTLVDLLLVFVPLLVIV